MGILSGFRKLVGQSGPVVGLDIGHSTIKCVEIEKSGDSYRLLRAEVEPIVDNEGDQVTEAETRNAIRRLAERWGLGDEPVVTSVSGESVIVRPIPVPIVDEKQDLSLMVQSEAREFIPFDMSEVILDYQSLGKIEAGSGIAHEMLVVAARRELIDSHLAMLDSTGLDGAVIDVDAIALVNALLVGCNIGDTETLAVVNIGSDVTNIAILRHRMLRFTRDLNIAGRNITRSIMTELNVDYEKAEELKAEHGLKSLFGEESEDSDSTAEGGPAKEVESHGSIVDEVYAAIDALDSSTDLMGTDISTLAGGEGTVVATLAEQVLSDIASEVKRSLLFYENQMDGEPVDRVLIAGGTAQLPGVVQYFEKEIDSQVELMQPLAKIENDLSVEYREQMGPSLATGIGLALRCAN